MSAALWLADAGEKQKEAALVGAASLDGLFFGGGDGGFFGLTLPLFAAFAATLDFFLAFQ